MSPQTVADHLLTRLRQWDVQLGRPGDGVDGLPSAWGRAEFLPHREGAAMALLRRRAEPEHLLDRTVRNVEHGRFERSLSRADGGVRAAPPGQPGHPRRPDRPVPPAGGADHRDSGGRRRAGRADDPALRPPDRRSADGLVAVGQHRRRGPALLGRAELFVSDGSANPALTIMALASRLAERMVSGAAMDDAPTARAGRVRPRAVRGTRRRVRHCGTVPDDRMEET